MGRTGYDTNGNVRHMADAAGNRKLLDYTDYFTNKPAGLGTDYIDHYDLHAEVTYDYDELDRLTLITHRGEGQTTGTGQTRSFAYDIWGRAANETTLEAGQVSYTYTSNELVEIVSIVVEIVFHRSRIPEVKVQFLRRSQR